MQRPGCTRMPPGNGHAGCRHRRCTRKWLGNHPEISEQGGSPGELLVGVCVKVGVLLWQRLRHMTAGASKGEPGEDPGLKCSASILSNGTWRKMWKSRNKVFYSKILPFKKPDSFWHMDTKFYTTESEKLRRLVKWKGRFQLGEGEAVGIDRQNGAAQAVRVEVLEVCTPHCTHCSHTWTHHPGPKHVDVLDKCAQAALHVHMELYYVHL